MVICLVDEGVGIGFKVTGRGKREISRTNNGTPLTKVLGGANCFCIHPLDCLLQEAHIRTYHPWYHKL